MAKFQIGDKVKFLNAIGGGVVTKITDDFVFVQDETGFDMPMQATELIRMADMSGAGKMFNQQVGAQQPADVVKAAEVFTPKKADTVEGLQETVKQLQSQVANLKDQVALFRRDPPARAGIHEGAERGALEARHLREDRAQRGRTGTA